MSRYPIIIGHRGACGDAPENTMASFERAIALGVDMIEFDVMRSLSGEMVVFHDETLERLTGQPLHIAKMPLTALRQIDIGGGQRILSLTDALDFIDRRVPVNIEIKCLGIAAMVAQVVEYYVHHRGWHYEDFLVSAYKYRQMQNFRRYNPSIRLAALVEDHIPNYFWTHMKELNVTAIHTSPGLIEKGMVNKAHSRGYKVNVFTINDRSSFRRMQALGIDGVFTDVPACLIGST